MGAHVWRESWSEGGCGGVQELKQGDKTGSARDERSGKRRQQRFVDRKRQGE